MTFREWIKADTGTYWALWFVSMLVATVVPNQLFDRSLLMHVLLGIPLLFLTQFVLCVIAWQIGRRRRRNRA